MMRSLTRQIQDVAVTETGYRIYTPSIVVTGYGLSAVMGAMYVVGTFFSSGFPVPPSTVWFTIAVMLLPTFLMGWLYARYSWMEIDRAGICVVNPLNVAWIPWSALRNAEENSNLLRIETGSWSISCWAVHGSNWESFAHPTRVDRLAQLLRDRAASTEDSDQAHEAGPAVKRWRIPARPVLGLLVLLCVSSVVLLM